MPDTIDTQNKFMVGVSAGQVLFLRPPPSRMSKDDALNLAGWLVAMADDADKFPAILDAIQSA